MRKLLVLQCILFSILLKAQVSGVPSSSSMSQTRYNDVSVNESSGRVTQNIPLFNYSVGRLNVPIALNYVGNGVKVVQQSNWVGTNWNLSAGGVVTRVVNDYPDELASSRIFLEDVQVLANQVGNYDFLNSSTLSDSIDLKADIFSFSFPGYSGSFYLDKMMTPRLIDNNVELKIRFFRLTNTIEITTPTGEIYYFGGADASEKTTTSLTHTGKPGQGSTEQLICPLVTTAFYLYQIENSNGDNISIEYDDTPLKDYVLFEKQELPLAHTQGFVNEACYDLDDFSSLKRNIFHGTIHNSKKVKSVYSSNSDIRIDFNMSNLFLPSDGIIDTPQYDDKILNSISVFNTRLNEQIKRVDLNYLLPNGVNSYRFFLEKISIFNSLTSLTPCESFRFEYNAPHELPSRFSTNIDLLGYFNGAINGPILIAQDQNLEFDSAFQNLAVRTPNFDYASKGVLKKIFSPTGGVTEFEYESPRVRTITQVGTHINMHRSQTGCTPVSFNIGGEFPVDPTDPVLYNPKNQNLKVDLSVQVESGGTYHSDRIIVEVKDVTTGSIQSQYITLVFGTYSYSTIFSFPLLKDHAYTVTLKQSSSSPTSSQSPLEAYAVGVYDFYKDFEAMGLRIKGVKNFTQTNVLANQKRYLYRKAKNTMLSIDESPVVTFNPKMSVDNEQYCCTAGDIENHFDVVSLISDPFSYYFASSDNQVEYKYVTVSYGGDEFEEGGLEKHFVAKERDKAVQFLYPGYSYSNDDVDYGANNSNNNDCFNGTLLKEKVVKNSDGYLYYDSEVEYVYDPLPSIDHQINNVVTVKSDEGCIIPTNEFPSPPVIGTYSVFSYRNNLKSIIKTTFSEPFPINGETVFNKISTVTNFEYSNLRGLPNKIKNIDSNGTLFVTEYLYPNSSSSIGVATANQIAYQNLYNQNVLQTPIQTITKKVDANAVETVLGTSRSLFSTFPNGKVALQKIMTAKANSPLKSNIEFTNYDNQNNLVEITQENQLKKSFIYGYNSQMVIAELNNVGYNTISPVTMANLQTLSDNITDAASELQLFNALQQLRVTFPDAQITTNVYNKYLQLKSSTDSRGDTIYYEYDDCKQLRLVKDKNNNIIEESSYNLKNN